MNMTDIPRRTHAQRGRTTMVFGKKLVIDLDGCDKARINDPAAVRRFATQLVAHLKMRAYGDPLVEDFGHDDPVTSGLTLVQLIETSDITAHFSPYLDEAHIDIFSCRDFDSQAAMEFCAMFFGATSITYTEIVR